MGWIRNYRTDDVRQDFVAPLTVAVVAVPQSMACALIAGLPVQFGLYAAFVPCVVGSLWGSSVQLVTGPTNAISLVVFSSLTGIVDPCTDPYIQLAFMLALLTGVIQIALGMARRAYPVLNWMLHAQPGHFKVIDVTLARRTES